VTCPIALRTARKDPNPGLRALLPIALAIALAGGLVSCKTVDEAGPRKSASGAVARLGFAGGSAVGGSANFQPVDGGVVVLVALWTGTSGRWRAVIHATGNCTSSNAFSAGPPLMVPGLAEPVSIPIVTGVEGRGDTTLRIAGLAIDGPAGINGRSVVVHAGALGPLDAQPGVANGRVACGVIETARPLF
jgi:Cu/Zn superoxide dismutase